MRMVMMMMMVIIRECTCLLRIWDIVVCIGTNYRVAGQEFESWQRKRIFLLQNHPEWLWGPPSPIFSG